MSKILIIDDENNIIEKFLNEIAKDITEVEQKLIDSFMPGPFTIILDEAAFA